MKAEDGETVVFSFIEWPDKATRDKAWKKIMADESMKPDGEMPFDGKRMFWGGFEQIVDTAERRAGARQRLNHNNDSNQGDRTMTEVRRRTCAQRRSSKRPTPPRQPHLVRADDPRCRRREGVLRRGRRLEHRRAGRRIPGLSHDRPQATAALPAASCR